jgi:two-component system cell cycle sensor histidine kinase/response regulator CckA
LASHPPGETLEESLKLLLVEDSEDDAQLLLRELSRGGYAVEYERVEVAEEMTRLLKQGSWDLVISDYSLPRFDALEALKILKTSGLDLPFIIVSGAIGEDIAVSAMRSGAHDYLHKDNLKKLIPVIQRELREAEEREGRRRANKARRNSETQYRLLFDNNPQPMWVYDLETLRFLAVNESAIQHYGYSREQFLGMTIKEIRPPEDVPALLGHVAQDSGDIDKAGVWKHVKRNGEVIDVEITSHKIPFSGRPADLVLCHDVTQRNKAEAELRRSEERYRELVENAQDMIYEHDLDGNYTSSNEAAERITGYSRAETLNLNYAQIVAPEYLEQAREMFRRKLAGESVTAYELEFIARDGTRIAVEVNTRLVFHDGVPVGVQGIARDVRQRKLLEEQLRQAQKLEAIGQLAGGVAHDFNNLLTVISGYTNLALRTMPADDPHFRNLQDIKTASDHAAALTRQLLAFSRKQVLQPKVFAVNAIVTELEKMLRRMIDENIEFRTSLGAKVGNVKADPGQIEQVIMNLVLNARDAMPSGGKLIIETNNVQLDETYARQHVSAIAGSYVLLAVSDTGMGIDEETLKHIFDPFFTTKQSGRGTGLGLSTVYGIVKQSGGNIWVYSEPGRGTTFKIYLPRVVEPVDQYKPAALPVQLPRATETILLVEDAEMVRNLAKEVLETTGYRVLDAANGKDALQICKNLKEPIHLLLTDVVMPEMSGHELASRLVSLHPETKVLYMSGYTEDAIVHHGMLKEGINYIEKPFTPDALALKVREVLQG